MSAKSKEEFFNELLLRDIPDRHLEVLRTIQGVRDVADGSDGGEICRELRTAYWQVKLIHDRHNSGDIEPAEWTQIGLLAGQGVVKPLCDMKFDNIIELWNRKEVSYGTDVKFRFRGVEMSGKLSGLTSNQRLVVVVDEEGNEREISPEDVWECPKESSSGSSGPKRRMKRTATS